MNHILWLAWGLLMAIGTWAAGTPILQVLVPDERATPSAQVTDAPTGAEADAGVANLRYEVAATSTNMTQGGRQRGAQPVAAGTPGAASTTITVGTKQAGRVDLTGTYTYVESGVEYGQIPLTVVSGFETALAAPGATGYNEPRGIPTDDGTIIVVYEDRISALVDTIERDPSTHTWGNGTTVLSELGPYTANVHPSPEIYRIPRCDGGYTYWIAVLETDTTLETPTLRLSLSYSDDEGATWTEPQATNLAFSVSTIYYEKLRIAYDELSGNLIAGVVRNNASTYTGLYYVSKDGGWTWRALSGANQSDVRNHDIRVLDGCIYLATLDGSGNVDLLKMTGVSTQWSQLSAISAAGAYVSATDKALTLSITPNGWIWVDYRTASTYLLARVYSTDGGVTFSTASDGYLLEESSATSHLMPESTVYQDGRMLQIGTMISSGTTKDSSIVALLAGGISSMTPSWAPENYDGFVPTDIPATRSGQHVFTTSGATAESIATSSSQIVYDMSNDNSTGYITTDYPIGIVDNANCGVMWILSPDSTGGSTSSDAIALRIRANSTSDGKFVDAGIRIDMTNRSVQAYDWRAGANVGTSGTWSASVPVVFYAVVSYYGTGSASKMSVYYRLTTQEAWTTLVADQTLTRSVGSTKTILWGKVSASTANVKTIAFFPALGPLGTTADTSPETLGIRASSRMNRLPNGLWLRWDGGALLPGNTWTLSAGSTTSPKLTSPHSVAPSPLRRWVSTAVSAGATVKPVVYDFGSSYRGWLAKDNGLVGIQWAETPGASIVYLQYWDGAAFQNIISASTIMQQYPSWARATATSYTFYPGASANTDARLLATDELKGLWCYIADNGGDAVAGYILRNGGGQFTNDGCKAWIELDPATVVTVAGGGLASLATTSGSSVMNIYANDGIAVAAQSAEAIRYYRVAIAYAPGFTAPASGLLAFGEVHTFDRPYRAGASINSVTDPRLPRALRRVTVDYDQLLTPVGTYQSAGATVQNTMSFNGSTPRATVDNNERVLLGLLDKVGRKRGAREGTPIGVVLDGDWQADPGSSTQVYLGRSVMACYMSRTIDVTVGRGFLRPSEQADNQHGTSVTFDEVALYLPT